MSLIATLDRLIDELRNVGLPISIAEKLDAATALGHADLGDRRAVKDSLAATLVKSAEHESAFDTVFDIFFGWNVHAGADPQGAPGEDAYGLDEAATGEGAGRGGPTTGGGSGRSGLRGLRGLDDAAVIELLITSLTAGEQGSLLQRQLSALLVERHAGFQPGRAVAGTYYLFRTMRAVDPDRILTRLVERAEAVSADAAGDPLSRRLLVEDFERRIAAFRQEIEAEIRRRLVADRGAQAVARTLRSPLPEDIDFLTAATTQLTELQGVLQPLSRKLGALMVRRQRHGRSATVDFRATMRASLSTGGMPVDVHYRVPRPAKPELIVLADISGSVSSFAAFTLQLTYALRAQFSRVKGYVFVDGVDEVTSLLVQARHVLDVTAEINRLGLGVWLDGRSDYGNALETFWLKYGTELRSRTTVLMLGDARSNYHSPRSEILGKIAARAGHVFWLNPEPRTAWNSGDSVIGQYAQHCDEVIECRNVRQLRSFVERLS